MGIKEKLPLINSDKKGTRIAGYIIYAFIFLNVLGAILPTPDSSETGGDSNTAQSAEVVPNTVDEWYTAAGNIFPQNEADAKKKIEYYQHVLDADPNNVSSLWGTAVEYRFSLQDDATAMKYLDKILPLQPRNVYFLDKKSMYLDEAGKKEEAMAIQDKIIGIANDGKPFQDTEWGEEADQCGRLMDLSYAWTTKGQLAIDLKLGGRLVNEYYDKGKEYAAESNRCKGIV